MRLAIAGNLMAPAVLLLEERGFVVSRESSQFGETWTAQRGPVELVAEDPVQVLGLAAIVDARGEDWRATDQELEDLLKRFHLNPSE